METGVPLGLMEGIRYDELEFKLEPGDTLIFASDGVMDALSVKNEFYDVQRFMESIRVNSGKEISECLKDMHLDLRQFVGGAEFSDDVTIIALRRKR